jgi:photosystem II stability/assembly factor-like uncharacterized protein
MNKKAVLLASLFVIFSIDLCAQGEWTSFPGLYGPDVKSLVETADGKLIAAAASGLYRSTDHGTSWTRISRDIPNEIFVDRNNKVFVSMLNAQLLTSTDGGNTFDVTGHTPSPFSKIRRLANGKLVAMIEGLNVSSFFISADEGVSWTRQHIFSRNLPHFRLNVVENIIIISCYDGLFVSHDEGTSFTEQPLIQPYSLIVNSTGVIYQATHEGIYESANLGTTWTKISYNLWSSAGFLGFSSTQELLYFDPSGITYKLNLAGKVWEPIALNFPSRSYIATATVATKSGLFVVGYDGIWKTTDLAHYEPASKGIVPGFLRSLRLTNDGGIIVATSTSLDKYKNGQWTRKSHLVTGERINVGKIFAFPNDHLFLDPALLSSDNGETWKSISLPFHATTKGLDDKLYGLVHRVSGETEVFESIDFGLSWRKINVTGLPNSASAFTTAESFAADSSQLFIVRHAENALYRINLKSLTTEKVFAGFSSIYSLKVKNNSLYAFIDGLLKRSDDGGKTWKDIAPAPRPNYTLLGFEVFGNEIVAGGHYGQLVISKDKGDTWTSHHFKESDHGQTRPIYFDRDDRGFLYVGIEHEGIFGSPFPLLKENNPPGIVGSIPKQGNEDEPIVFTRADFESAFSDADGDVLKFVQITSLPSEGILKLNDATISAGQVVAVDDLSKLLFCPAKDFFGTTKFTFQASDGIDYSIDEGTVEIETAGVNDPPAFTIAKELTLVQDFQGEIILIPEMVVIANEQPEAVTYSYTVEPANNISANSVLDIGLDPESGKLTVTSIAGAFGSCFITLTANDGQPVNNLHSERIFVVVENSNKPPVFNIQNEITLPQNFAGEVKLTPQLVNPEEGEQITFHYEILSGDGVLSLAFESTTGQVTLTSIANSFGDVYVELTANDGQPVHNLHSDTIHIQVLPFNKAPIFTIQNLVTLKEDFTNEVVITPQLIVAPGEEYQVVTYTYSVISGEEEIVGLSLNAQTGEIKLTAIQDEFGELYISLNSNDGQPTNSTYSQTLKIVVEPVNDAPHFTTPAHISLKEDFATEEVIAPNLMPSKHEDLQTITFELMPEQSDIVNISFDSTTGTIILTSVKDAYGEIEFTLTSDDHQSYNNQSSRKTQSVSITSTTRLSYCRFQIG